MGGVMLLSTSVRWSRSLGKKVIIWECPSCLLTFMIAPTEEKVVDRLTMEHSLLLIPSSHLSQVALPRGYRVRLILMSLKGDLLAEPSSLVVNNERNSSSGLRD